jgi:hypothetical protein
MPYNFIVVINALDICSRIIVNLFYAKKILLNISPTAVSRAATMGRKLPDHRMIQKQLLDI